MGDDDPSYHPRDHRSYDITCDISLWSRDSLEYSKKRGSDSDELDASALMVKSQGGPRHRHGTSHTK